MRSQAESAEDLHRHFADTRWSLVRIANGSAPDRARQALLELCLRYWYPVYAYLRRCGHTPELAQDIARAFFEDLLHAQARMTAPQRSGRFREFLTDALHRFLARDWRTAIEASALADLEAVPPVEALESRHRNEPLALSPERSFERNYALEVLSTAHRKLREEALQAGREPMFEALLPYLACDPLPGQYETIANAFRIRPLALVIALKRLRQRFQELVEDELAQTVSSADEFEHERAALLAALQP